MIGCEVVFEETLKERWIEWNIERLERRLGASGRMMAELDEELFVARFERELERLGMFLKSMGLEVRHRDASVLRLFRETAF